MACCSSCNYTPCSCAPITGEADAPQCLPPGSEVALDSIGGFDEFNCARALNPFRGFDDKGNPVTIITTPPNTQAAFLFQNSTGNVCWTDRPKVILPPRQIGLDVPSTPASPLNSIPKLVGVDTTGEWKEIAARTGQTASTVKWNPTHGFTLKPDTADQQGVCTTLTSPVNLSNGVSTYDFYVASTAVFAPGLSVLVDTKEYIVQTVTSPTLMNLKAVVTPTASTPILSGASVCGVGFKPISGIASAYVDTLTGSVTTGGVTTSNSLTFPPDGAGGNKAPGLFWRDQTGKVSFLAAPVDGSGVVVANQVLKTPTLPTTGAANLPTFVSIPGGYTWLATPSTIAPFTYSLSPGGPSDASVNFNVSSLAPAGSKMVILDVKANFALGNTSGGATVYVTINGYYASLLSVGNSFGTASDTNQIIVPIESNTILTMTTDATGVINNGYSQTIRVLGFIG